MFSCKPCVGSDPTQDTVKIDLKFLLGENGDDKNVEVATGVAAGVGLNSSHNPAETISDIDHPAPPETLELFKCLKKYGFADVHESSSHGETPLHTAAKQGDQVSVLLLLKHKANIMCKNRHDATPLHYAASAGSGPCLNVLLAAEKDTALLAAKDNDGRTALHLAAQQGKQQCVQILINAGAVIGAKDQSGKTPYDLVDYYGDAEAIRQLFRCAASSL